LHSFIVYDKKVFLVRCRDWDIDALDLNCVFKALTLNLWRTAADLKDVTKEDMKTILVSKLSKHLDNSKHSLQDLSDR